MPLPVRSALVLLPTVEATRKALDGGARCVVLVNPGNPSGANLDEAALATVVRFAHEKGLVLMADEVYQENVLTAHPFKSLSRVVHELGLPVEVASMHSLSKGFLGECGVRGGYAVFENFDPEVLAQFVKMKSIELCSNTIGQLSVGLMVRPPAADAKALYEREKAEVLAGLSERAAILTKTMNSLDGISMPPIGGAMYAFPQVHPPCGRSLAAAALPPPPCCCRLAAAVAAPPSPQPSRTALKKAHPLTACCR